MCKYKTKVWTIIEVLKGPLVMFFEPYTMRRSRYLLTLVTLIVVSQFIAWESCDGSASAAEVVQYGKLAELPLAAVTPDGWTREFLDRQRAGLTGHPHVSGYPFNTPMWTGKVSRPVGHWGEDWWPYEQTGYYIDGAIQCAHLVKDQTLLEKIQANFDYTIAHIKEDGKLGGNNPVDDWSRAVFARAMIADYSVTKNPAILDALKRNYLTTPRLYTETLVCTNIEVLCWLYAQTGERALLEMAEESYREGNLRQQILNPEGHAVCYCEKPMLSATLYNHTGKHEYLKTAVNGLQALEERHVLVDGVPSAVEGLYGNAPDCAHEMCNVMALSWSCGYVLMATKDPVWADKIERIVFNAGLGGITKDFRAHQYYSAPNQAIAAEDNSRYNDDTYWGTCARARLAYRTGHDTECCTGSIHRMLPNYVKRMWMVDRQSKGIAATLYGPSCISAKVGENQQVVRITETTNYPFSENITFTVSTEEPVEFTLSLRIPHWCNGATITINNRKQDWVLKAGTFAELHRMFKNGDKIELHLPMELKLSRWGKNDRGLALERGPLVYALPVEARELEYLYVTGEDTANFPSYFLYPNSTWNYALDVNEENLETAVEVIKNQETADGFGWDLAATPVRLKVPVRKVVNWTLDPDNSTPVWPDSLELSDEREFVTLVPMGCTLLRMTILPECPTASESN